MSRQEKYHNKSEKKQYVTPKETPNYGIDDNEGEMNESSRLSKSQKRKRTNFILNIMIVVLLIAIATTLYFVILTTDTPGKQPEGVKTASGESSSEQVIKKKSSDDDNSSSKKKTKETSDIKITKKAGPADSNIKEEWTADWQPIGTKQTGQHVNSYESGSDDWAEKIAAIAKTLTIAETNVQTWYIENGVGSGSDAIATVSPKDKEDDTYRLYLSWVDKKGWKTDKVEELKTNDKK
ncbi:MAG: YrrS family protein [Brochothrix thermosphacta]|uniref:YrrS family protein n=1 Tax=Brochothrix thermosphacta TaxID=2756 RepID=UPI0009BFDE1D|nr:YrrS family protein [Brochothrix thermosphacta]